MKKKVISKDKRYEDKHKEQRKARCMVWGTSVERTLGEEINGFLKKYGYTKVQLIQAGYDALFEDAACKDVKLGKMLDKYDDFFGFEDVGNKKPNT